MRVRHTIIFIIVLLLLSLALSVLAAGNTEINVTVPSKHTVTVYCGFGGKIKIGQTDYTGTNSFTVARHSVFEFTAVPDNDYILDVIAGNGRNKIELDGNTASIEKVYEDVVITVSFRLKSQSTESQSVHVPVITEDESITVEAILTGDRVKIDIDEAKLDELIDTDSEAQTVTVNASGLGSDINTVIIPKSMVKAVAEHIMSDDTGSLGMNIMMPGATVNFDYPALTSIIEQAPEDTVTLHVEQINNENLNHIQKETIKDFSENAIVIEILLTSGNTYITDFNGGSTDIKLPYTPREDEDTETISVWFVSADGDMENIPCRYENGFVYFTVLHFSNYIIRPGIVTTESHCFICKLLGHNISPWCIISSVLIIVVLCVAILLVFIWYRKKGKHLFKSNRRL